MKVTDPPDEAEALARLREHERELDRRLEDARGEVAGLLAEARQAVERLREDGAAELRQEVERLRQEASRERQRLLAGVRDETGRRIEALREQAARNRDEALAWLLSRVAGRVAP
jgi:vacuolar-type H+-ATPase subunit H